MEVDKTQTAPHLQTCTHLGRISW